MKVHELICVVSGQISEPPGKNTQCITVGGYTAVLSLAARKAIQLPPSRKDILQNAAKRQEVFEALMSRGTVLVAAPQQWLSVPQARAFLIANHRVFAALCDKLAGMSQFQVTVSWNAAGVLSHFQDTPELSDLFKSGTATAASLSTCVAQLKARISSQILQLLEAEAADIIALPTIEGMLSNTVVLIPMGDEPRLDKCVEEIDAIWTEGFSIRQIGPSAAGSFALLELKWVSPEDIVSAHQTLSVAQGASPETCAAARRVALMKPDANPTRIEAAAQIVAAAVPGTESGFHIATVRSEQSGSSVAELSEVA